MNNTKLGLLALTMLAVAGCGKEAATPPKHPWASFKAGSYAKIRMTSAMNVAGKPINTTVEIKQTLVELKATSAVVEIETTVMGKTSTTRKDFPLSAASPLTGAPGDGVMPAGVPAADSGKVLNKGTETITIAGKPVSCKWTESAVAQGANSGTVKIYMSEQIPGGIAKMITKISGNVNTESTLEVIEFLAK
ncbi:MAG: hypothetical protein FJ398_14660 [Verrucomicrobia bacterium]|nr:hypothetical protein [Verrucomicrobiota bacterium]